MKQNKDYSWLWHCCENVVDYKNILSNKKTAESLNKAAYVGFRLALRKLEAIGVIRLTDIDRSKSEFDQHMWDHFFEDSVESEQDDVQKNRIISDFLKSKNE